VFAHKLATEVNGSSSCLTIPGKGLGLYILIAGDYRPIEQQEEKSAEQAGKTSWRRTDRITGSRLAAPPRNYRYRCSYHARGAMEAAVRIPDRLVETAHHAQREIRGSREMCHLS